MQTRRTFVGAGVTLAAVALAGCNGQSGGNGTETGRYTNLVADTESRPLRVQMQKPGTVAAIDSYGGVESNILGVNPGDVEYSLTVTVGGASSGTYAMLFGPFEFEEMQSRLEEQGQGTATIEEVDAIGGFRTLTIAASQQQTAYYGVDDGTLVFASGREMYESATEAATTDVTTLFDTSDDLDTLASVIGDPDDGRLDLEPQQLQTDPTGNATAGGAGIQLGEDESEYTSGIMYETEAEASENESAVADAVRDRVGGITSLETEVDGRIVIVRGTATTSEL